MAMETEVPAMPTLLLFVIGYAGMASLVTVAFAAFMHRCRVRSDEAVGAAAEVPPESRVARLLTESPPALFTGAPRLRGY